MSKSKIVGIMALTVFAMFIILAGNAVAGERFKWRAVWYTPKSESINVPGEEGRIMVICEDKGILGVIEGSKLMDGMAGVDVYCLDMNTKTGTGFGHGMIQFTNRDGDKIYWEWEGRTKNGGFGGPATITKGTGKFEGLKGKANWSTVTVTPNQFYADWEGEMDLPRR